MMAAFLFKQKSQTYYYMVEVTAGLNQSDIHGHY